MSAPFGQQAARQTAPQPQAPTQPPPPHEPTPQEQALLEVIDAAIRAGAEKAATSASVSEGQPYLQLCQGVEQLVSAYTTLKNGGKPQSAPSVSHGQPFGG